MIDSVTESQCEKCLFIFSFLQELKSHTRVLNGSIHYVFFFFFFQTRMSVRLVGCAGVLVLFSYFQEQVKSRQLRKLGETLVGIFLIAYVYIINNTYEDKRAFLMHIPGGDWSRYFITLVLACGAISFFSGYFLRDVSISLAIVFAILTVAIDCDIQYWVNKRGMLYWNQVRVIADDLCIIIGFCLLISRGDNKIKMD